MGLVKQAQAQRWTKVLLLWAFLLPSLGGSGSGEGLLSTERAHEQDLPSGCAGFPVSALHGPSPQ